MRVLIAVPTNAAPAMMLVENDVVIDTARIVILTASTLDGLNEHTARLQTAAAFVDWELRPADGLHRRIIERTRHHDQVDR